MDIDIDVLYRVNDIWSGCLNGTLYLNIFLNRNFVDRAHVRHWDGGGGGSNDESYLDHNMILYSLLLRAQETLILNV